MQPRKSYDNEMEDLANSFMRMGAQAISAVDKAIGALTTGDRALAGEVVAYDVMVDKLEQSLERKCCGLLLRQQPVGREFRQVTAIFKMAGDLERIGDAAAGIAKISMQIPPGLPARLVDVKKMAAAAREMVADAIKAYAGESMVLADYVIRRDEIVNGYFDSIKSEIALYILQEPRQADLALDYGMIIKYIERIADHAVNLSEWVKYYKTGLHRGTRVF